MTNEQKILELLATLDVAITYIQAIADDDSPTLEYLLQQYDALAN